MISMRQQYTVGAGHPKTNVFQQKMLQIVIPWSAESTIVAVENSVTMQTTLHGPLVLWQPASFWFYLL